MVFANQTSDVQLRMKALYHLLVSTTRGRALTILQMVPKNNGAVAGKRLKAEYEPRSEGRLTEMLMGIFPSGTRRRLEVLMLGRLLGRLGKRT